MNPTRKVLKLSSKGPTQNGLNTGKTASILDDSLDDFIITRPLRAERRLAKNSAVTKRLDNSEKTIDSEQVDESSRIVKEVETIRETVKNKHSSAVQNKSNNSEYSAASVCHQCPLCARSFSTLEQKERHVSKCAQSQNVDLKTLSAAEELQERQMAERLSLGLPSVAPVLTKTKTSRRRAIDPSSADLSLAIALSESLQSAAESERRKEEEMLLSENLVEVISDLRQEDGESGRLAHVFQRPADVPAAGPSAAVTKIKRKPKPRSKKTDQNKDYILAIRSHTERERLIAQRAAAILSEEANNEPPKTLPKKSKYFHYVSEFVNRHKRKDIPLWKYSSLPLEGFGDEMFYVGALSRVLSPSKKKAGYTNILLHVSQLPGRNSSQVDPGITLSSTQAVLEELALGADGGFLDEPVEQEPSVPVSKDNRLADDWSHFVDNPHMSDLAVQTSSQVIRAHRLVLAVRCPNMIKEAPTNELNWSQFSASAAKRVIRFIYTGRYEHGDGRDAENVYRIARRYCINELIDLLPCHYGSSFLDGEEEEEEMDKEKKSTENSSVIDAEQEDESEPIKNPSCSMAMEQTVENQLADSQFAEDSHSLQEDEQQPDMESNQPFSLERTARTPIDMEISASVSRTARPPPEPEPMSPDMFAISDDDDSVIDLTQEAEDKHGHNLPPRSQFAGSCEGSLVNSDDFDGDLSMADGSKVGCPTRSLSPNNDSNALRQRYEDTVGGGIDDFPISPQNEVVSVKSVTPPVKSFDRPTSPLASTSKANYSFYGNQSWNDYDYGGMDHQFPSSPRSESEQDPIYSSQSKTTTKVAASSSFRHPDADRPPDALDYEEFPDELNSLFQHDFSGHLAEPLHVSAAAAEMSTPEAPTRPAKKRKIEVTPLPDYQTMNTPGLKKELDKYGLKPLKRKNAVKLLHHIYEELHPLVTDSESSFSETPQRPGKSQHNKSPTRSPACSSSSMQSASSSSEEDDEMEEIAELDRQHAAAAFTSSQASQSSSLSLNEQLKKFLAVHQEIHKMVLRYDPIPFDYLYKEVRKAGIKCKAADLLDWCDQQCVACRMNKKNNKDGARSPGKSPRKSPNKASKTTTKRVAKKLIS